MEEEGHHPAIRPSNWRRVDQVVISFGQGRWQEKGQLGFTKTVPYDDKKGVKGCKYGSFTEFMYVGFVAGMEEKIKKAAVLVFPLSMSEVTVELVIDDLHLQFCAEWSEEKACYQNFGKSFSLVPVAETLPDNIEVNGSTYVFQSSLCGNFFENGSFVAEGYGRLSKDYIAFDRLIPGSQGGWEGSTIHSYCSLFGSILINFFSLCFCSWCAHCFQMTEMRMHVITNLKNLGFREHFDDNGRKVFDLVCGNSLTRARPIVSSNCVLKFSCCCYLPDVSENMHFFVERYVKVGCSRETSLIHELFLSVPPTSIRMSDSMQVLTEEDCACLSQLRERHMWNDLLLDEVSAEQKKFAEMSEAELAALDKLQSNALVLKQINQQYLSCVNEQVMEAFREGGRQVAKQTMQGLEAGFDIVGKVSDAGGAISNDL